MIHEIRDENILKYYIPTILGSFNFLEEIVNSYKQRPNLDTLDIPGINTVELENILGYINSIKYSMKVWLDKYVFTLSK